MPREASTKIVATLGPASSTQASIQALYDMGVDVFRLNFSHGAHKDHAARVAAIRTVEKKGKRPVAILADLQGPKLRVGSFKNGPVELKVGGLFRFDLKTELGDAKRVCLPHPEIFRAISKGVDLLLDDGKLRLRVEKRGKDFADCRIITGGLLSERKGVNLPGAVLPISALTEKDRRDLAFALDTEVDWIALSFVQRAEDIAEARRLVGGRAAVLAKLEKPSAIEQLDAIVELADGIMVARGDLGVEMPPESVPGLQKKIVRACRAAGKPVIVATQMLDSMVHAPTPTRAEASDVATAVYDGADAVMLSAETASGDYPLEAVSIMERIIQSVEHDPLYRSILDAVHSDPEATAADAITAAARQIAHTINARAIVTYTTSGSTSLRAARERPEAPILCLTENARTARRLALAWGVRPVITKDVRDFADMVTKAARTCREVGIGRSGDAIVITAGVPFGTPGATNILRIARLP